MAAKRATGTWPSAFGGTITFDEPLTFDELVREAADEVEETYAQYEACFIQVCDSETTYLPFMLRGLGWLWFAFPGEA